MNASAGLIVGAFRRELRLRIPLTPRCGGVLISAFVWFSGLCFGSCGDVLLAENS